MEKSLYRPQNELLQELLRELRKEAGLLQEELARRLNKSQSFVSKYENGERRLDGVELYFVCNALGLGFAEFARKYESLLATKGLDAQMALS